MTMKADDRLIAALDFHTMADVKALVETLGDSVSYYKVGMELFYSVGGEVVRYLRESHPKVRLLVRSRSRVEAQELLKIGVPSTRELLGSSIDVAAQALVEMGEDPAMAASLTERFRAHDEDLTIRMSQVADADERRRMFTQGRAEFLRLLETESGDEAGAGPDGEGPAVLAQDRPGDGRLSGSSVDR